jgi:hypothetical protein
MLVVVDPADVTAAMGTLEGQLFQVGTVTSGAGVTIRE